MTKPILFAVPLLTGLLLMAPPALAQRQQAIGAGVTPLNAAGELNGVDMSGSGTTGTLDVGVLGGPETDIYTANNPLVAGQLAVSTATSSQGNIVFNSSSTVNGGIGDVPPAGPYFLDISGGNTGTVVNFLGPVYATAITDLGTGTLNFDSGTVNAGAANFAGDGTIDLAPNTTLDGAVTTSAGADTGTLLLSDGSLINGAVGGGAGLKAVNVVGGSNTAGVTATVQGAVDTYSMSLGTNTLVINGALALGGPGAGAGGVVNTTIASSTVYGNARVLGATSLSPAVTVNVTVPSTAVLTVGTQFNIIQTQTGTTQTGTSGSLVTPVVQSPSNPLYAFSAVPLAGTSNGLVAIVVTSVPLLVPVTPVVPATPATPTTPATPAVPVVTIPAQPIAAPVVPALVALPATPAAAAVIAPINALTTPAAVVKAVAQFAPSLAGLGAPETGLQETRAFEDIWMSRLLPLCADTNRAAGETPRSCQGYAAPPGWWLRGFALGGNQNALGAYPGYSNAIYGTMIGYDAPAGPGTRLGFGLGYARSTISANVFTATNDANTYTATAFAGHVIGPWFVNGDLSFGWNQNSETRQIAFTGFEQSPHGSYSGQSYTAFAITGYNFFAGQFTITPLASLQYTYESFGKYTETDGGLIGLKVKSQGYAYVESGLGGKVTGSYAYAGGILVPELHAKWLHEIANPAARETASFIAAGSPYFSTPSFRSGADIFNAGAGATLLSCSCTAKNWSLELVYDFYAQTGGYIANAGMLKFTRSF
jgi:uncharacterized protein with beta-barrel porin domain